jgi:hypothetical protein
MKNNLNKDLQLIRKPENKGLFANCIIPGKIIDANHPFANRYLTNHAFLSILGGVIR